MLLRATSPRRCNRIGFLEIAGKPILEIWIEIAPSELCASHSFKIVIAHAQMRQTRSYGRNCTELRRAGCGSRILCEVAETDTWQRKSRLCGESRLPICPLTC